MSKENGLGAAYYLDGINLSGDTNAVDRLSSSMGLLMQTGIDKSAPERTGGLLDGEISWTSFFNPARAHPKLEDLPRADVIGSYFHKGATLGTPTASIVAKQANYDPTRAADGQLTLKVQALSNGYSLDWGLSLTAGEKTDAAPANGTGVDFNDWGGGNSFGLQAYLQLISFTGTDVTIKLQQSSDNGAGDAWADVVGGSFGALTAAPQGLRIATARDQAVERYLRVVTTGTFTSVTYRVSAHANRVVNPL